MNRLLGLISTKISCIKPHTVIEAPHLECRRDMTKCHVRHTVTKASHVQCCHKVTKCQVLHSVMKASHKEYRRRLEWTSITILYMHETVTFSSSIYNFALA